VTDVSSERLHATCIAICDSAIIIVGRSGTGKSDLALRLIDRGAILVSDDSTQLVRRGDHVIASAPDTIRGKIEMFGVGIIALQDRQDVRVRLIVDLDEPPTRMPSWTDARNLAGVDIPVVAIAGHEPSAPIKIEHALARVLA
jgi:serine kinase of HPr protein (carbohydrate metabolism regulator)